MYGLLLFVCWCVSAMGGSAKYEYYELKDAAVYFNEFITKYNKQYTDKNEEFERFKIFAANLEESNRLNNESEHVVYGITEYMDWTPEEFGKMTTCIGDPVDQYFCNQVKTDNDIPNVNVPDQFDWRQSGAVTSVVNQGQCGGCYAFSAAGSVEGQYAIKYRQLQELSKQQIIDCDSVSKGCNGGYPAASMNALIGLGGSVSEATYPYRGSKGSCNRNSGPAVARLSSCFSYRLSLQESLRKLLVSVGPVSIAVRATALQYYQRGVFPDDKCTGDINHAVLLVGYGTENGVPYWLVKNSWGTGWGEQGYFKVQRDGPGGDQGACGMLNNYMATPVVA